MKILLAALASLLLIIAPSAHAQETYTKATVTGTVQTELVISNTDGRIHTAPLNAKRIYQEFAVSPQDYELVLGTSSGLILLPRHAGASLPTLTIFGFGDQDILVNTKAKLFELEAAIKPGDNTNLFQNLAGEMLGIGLYSGPNFSFRNIAFTITARGNSSISGHPEALLKFKVTAGAPFTQQP
jgi:hypothetical protein